jgi:VRR-NUC domain
MGQDQATPLHPCFEPGDPLSPIGYRAIRETSHLRSPVIDSADIPERMWRLMSPADQKAHGHDPGAAAKALVRREAKEQKIFNAWLNIKLRERKLYSVNPRSDKATTIRKGHPDYTIFLPAGQMLLMEMKVAGGVLSKEQIECIEFLSDLGFVVTIPDSASEAITQVRKFL